MSVPTELHSLAEQVRLLKEDQQQARIEAARERERARSIKPIRIKGTLANLSATGLVMIGGGQGSADGPGNGYVWGLRGLGVFLSSAAAITPWIVGDNSGTLPAIGGPSGNIPSGTTGYADWSGVQALMQPGEYLGLQASGAVVSCQFTFFALEVAAEEVWKIT